MKKVLLVFWGALILLGWLGWSEGVVDRIAAVVNKEIIMLSEVEKGMEASGEEIRGEDRLERRKRAMEVRKKVLNQLIDEKLIEIEIKKLGIKVASKELEAAMEDIKRRNGITQDELEKYLVKEGMTFEAFKKQLEKKMQRTKLIQWSVKIDATPGEKDLKEFYQKNINGYRTPESYRPAHILFRIPQEATPEEVREIRKKCLTVLEKIKGGGDFKEMALLYSGDLSAKDGGELGDFRRGELIPALEKELLRLQVGEVGEIVRSGFGFHIVKLVDRKGGTPVSFEEAKERVEADYQEYQIDKAFKQFLSSLREKSVVDIRL